MTTTELNQEKSLSFEITNPTDDNLAVNIQFNFDALKNGILEVAQKYENLVFTDSEMVNAKNERAQLNKLKEKLNSEKIRVKKEILKTYSENFEPQVKELIELVQGPINKIDEQIVSYNQRLRAEKDTMLREYYNESFSNDFVQVEYDQIKHDEWLNSSYSVKKAKKEISDQIQRINTEVDTIINFNSKYQDKLIAIYLRNLDLGAVNLAKKGFEEQEKIIEKANLQAKAEEDAKKKAHDEKMAEIMTKVIASEQVVRTQPKQSAPRFERTFKVIATIEQLGLLDNFFSDNNIQYQIIG
mgnify:CR=1 FL=1